ncbi:MAG: HU family DNA-binding protein [Rhodanobacter sp.]
MKNIIKNLAAEAKVDEAEAVRVLKALGYALAYAMRSGATTIKVENMGEFRVAHLGPRKFKNPKNNQVYRLPARRAVHFKADEVLSKLLNMKTPEGML